MRAVCHASHNVCLHAYINMSLGCDRVYLYARGHISEFALIATEQLNTQALYTLDLTLWVLCMFVFSDTNRHLIKRPVEGLPKNASLEELQNFFYEQGPAVGSTFQPVNGGFDLACRGANIGDNSASNYRVVSLQSLADCEQKCLDSHGCVAVEYSKGRCELWLKKVEATLSLGGS